MNIEEIKKGLIAYKGNRFIYTRVNHEAAEPVYFCRVLSYKEMKLINKNPALLAVQD